jgi:hypothetical protein
MCFRLAALQTYVRLRNSPAALQTYAAASAKLRQLQIQLRCIIDSLPGAISGIAVIDISAKVVSLCLQYSVEVKHLKGDIERLY